MELQIAFSRVFIPFSSHFFFPMASFCSRKKILFIMFEFRPFRQDSICACIQLNTLGIENRLEAWKYYVLRKDSKIQIYFWNSTKESKS